jgi:hypothetical protein
LSASDSRSNSMSLPDAEASPADRAGRPAPPRPAVPPRERAMETVADGRRGRCPARRRFPMQVPDRARRGTPAGTRGILPPMDDSGVTAVEER